MQRTFVIGDIHGAHSALLQCLEQSKFDYNSDRLICLGDICDRRPEVRECVDELLKIKHLFAILGNHDKWALDWMMESKSNEYDRFWSNHDQEIWKGQGGSFTIESYVDGVPESHLEFFSRAKYYHIEKNRLFVHGGIDHRFPPENQNPEDFLWDRNLVYTALESCTSGEKLTNFDEVFVGHTPTISFFPGELPESASTGISTSSEKFSSKEPRGGRNDVPILLSNVWLIDTGAGWPGGRLSMMDVESKEVFQSDVLE